MMDSTAQNARQMKASNRLRVLRLIRRGPIARSEVAAETGLTRAAISLIVGSLLREGIVIETGSRKSATGRRPVVLTIRPEYGYALGLTISRTGAEVGVVDVAGRLLLRELVDTKVDADINDAARSVIVTRFRQALRRAAANGMAHGGRLLGLGISTPGPVDTGAGTILNPPNFALWHDFRIAKALGSIAGGHVHVENNSQALAMAEQSYGIGRQYGSFLLIVVDSGVGGGIVLGGKLYSGWQGFGSEIGHTSIDQTGPQCGCGLRGCVELYTALPAVLQATHKRRPSVDNWHEFVDLAHNGDVFCRQLLLKQADALATAAVNTINVLELDAVILTGDILYRGEMLRAHVENSVNEKIINRSRRHIPVHLSPLGEHCELMAAGALPIERFFRPGPSRDPGDSVTSR